MMNYIFPKALIRVAVLGLGLAGVSRAAFVDFNGPDYSPGELNNSPHWVVSQNTGTSGDLNYVIQEGGLTTGAAPRQHVVAGGREASAYFNTAYDLSFTPVLTVSIFFSYTNVSASGGTPMTIGFSGGTVDALFNGFAGAGDMMLVRVNKLSNDNGQLVLQSRVGGVATTHATASSFALTDGNWYQLTAVFERTGTPEQFLLSGQLFDAFSDGTVGAAVAGQSLGPEIISSGTLWNDDSLYTGLRGFRSNGLGSFDNFSLIAIPIPEPTTIALLGLGLPALLRRRRR